jgi:hypothetical protein
MNQALYAHMNNKRKRKKKKKVHNLLCAQNSVAGEDSMNELEIK